MEELRDNDGYLVLDKQPFKVVQDRLNHLIFFIDNKKYFFKTADSDNKYSELIAEELSKDFCIPCAHYDLACYKGQYGVISEDFINDDKFISIGKILNDYYEESSIPNSHNNLMDIWSALDFRYKNQDLSNELMDNIACVFLFDVLLANGDRHVNNYGILENDFEVKLAPIFDNEYILGHLPLYEGMYTLGIDEDENILDEKFTGPDNKFLVKFLKESSSDYMDLLESKLWIISDENIDKIINRVEERINAKIDDKIKDDIKLKFSINYDNVKYTIEYVKERKYK